jgi:site-specific recombinase XerD
MAFLKKRGRYYHIVVNRQGRRTTITTGQTTLSDAKKALSEYNNLTPQNKEFTFRDFRSEYFIHSRLYHSLNYSVLIGYAFEQFEDFLNDNPLLADISKSDAEGFITHKISEGYKNISNGYLTIFKAAFNWAISKGYCSINPFAEIKKIKLNKNIPRFITEQELYLILAQEENQILRYIYATLFFTGMRISELLNLKWADVNLNDRIITVRNTKTFRIKSAAERIIPIGGKLLKILHRLRQDTIYLFYIPAVNLSRDIVSHRFKQALRKTEVNHDIRLHDLRHSCFTALLQRGASIYDVSRLAGHSDIKTTAIYLHSTDKTLRDTVKLLDRMR